MFLEIKVQRSVVNLEIGRLDDDLFERIVFLSLVLDSNNGGYPCVYGMFHHCENSIVKLVVVDVEHDLFSVQGSLFARTDDLGNVDPRPEKLEMFHSLLWFVLGVEDREFREHSHVCPLKTETSLHQCNEFIKEAIVFVLLNQLLQFLGMDNQVETADLSKTEFSLVDTCLIYLFPNPVVRTHSARSRLCGVGLACTVNSILEFAEVNQRRCQSGPIRDGREEDLRSLVQFLIVAFLTDIKNLFLSEGE